jgi:hypothetical protein
MSQIPFTTARLSPELLLQIAAQQLAGQFQVTTPAAGTPQQSFLDAIPFVNDGDVIRADHFNAIKAALTQLAAALGLSQRPIGVNVLSIFPTQGGGIDLPWDQYSEGISAPPQVTPDASAAVTYIPVTLPDGVDILFLGAVGELVSTTGSNTLKVQLERALTSADIDPDRTRVDGIVTFKAGNGPFGKPVPAQDDPRIPGLRRVDNKQFSYFLQVRWKDGGPTPKSAAIYGFEITYAYA